MAHANVDIRESVPDNPPPWSLGPAFRSETFRSIASKMTRQHPLLAALLGLWLVSCGGASEDTASFQRDPAVARGLQAARGRVVALREPDESSQSAVRPADVSALVASLTGTSGAERELGLESVKTLGRGSAPLLAVIAAKSDHNPTERRAACELLARLASPRAVEHLLQLCERAPESWLRSSAAWHLSAVNADHVLPRLLLRLKYEGDEECRIWLAYALGLHGNDAGLETLWLASSQATTAELCASVAARLDELAVAAGASTPEEHWRWYVSGSHEREAPASPQLELAIWQAISHLGGANAREAEEARYVLSRLGSVAAAPLARALHDEDVELGVQAAACLELMGPRANSTGAALITALSDESLAAAAAAALGTVADPAAEAPLRARLLDPSAPLDVRLACARSLGQLGLGASAQALREVQSSGAPLELRFACAVALVDCGLGDSGADLLLEGLQPDGERALAAEAALEAWLANSERVAAARWLEEWNSLAALPGLTTDPGEQRRRIEARRSLLLEAWDQLKGL